MRLLIIATTKHSIKNSRSTSCGLSTVIIRKIFLLGFYLKPAFKDGILYKACNTADVDRLTKYSVRPSQAHFLLSDLDRCIFKSSKLYCAFTVVFLRTRLFLGAVVLID